MKNCPAPRGRSSGPARLLALAGVVMLCMMRPAAQAAVIVDLVPAEQAEPRWKDIADNVYTEAYQTQFSYDDASVTLRYEERGATFVGRLVADGLKPNFAYQLKLGAAHDNPAMERLGYMGRWHWAGGQPNVRDAVFEANKSNPDLSSYLVFDYLVTDGLGHAEKAIEVNSTYHVLWRVPGSGLGGSRTPQPEDGPVLDIFVDPVPGPDGAYGPEDEPMWVGVYGEHEHTKGNVRPLPGELVIAEGDYEVDFLLTEESFHGTDRPLDGYWSTALVTPPDQMLRFSVGGERVIPEPCSLALAALGMGHLLLRRRRRSS